MKGKNYEYARVEGQTVLKLKSTDALNKKVLEIDERFLDGTLKCQHQSKDGQGWTGKCPFCSVQSSSKKQAYESYRPAYLTPRETGYVFYCCNCRISLPAFKFLLGAHGEEIAQEYAERRWNEGELCGAGFNCPLPQGIKEALLGAKEKRRDAYKQEYEERRMLNYQKKYGD